MASIQRLKSALTGEITYRAQVRVKGRPSESRTFSNKKDALEWSGRVETAISDGKHFPTRKAAKTSFAAAVARYRETVVDQLKPACRPARLQQLDYWVDKFAGATLVEITPDKVAEARDDLAAQTFTRGKARTDKKTGVVVEPTQYKRTGATVNRYLSCLSHLFSVAVREWRLLDRNPCSGISKKKESRGRVRFLSDEERSALLNACAQSGWQPLHALVLLALTTGARRGELITLRWADVDLKTARATVEDSKNGDRRVLPIVGKALEAVRGLKLHNSAASKFVFPQPSGLPGPYENFDAHWRAAVEAAGIKDMRFHDLRHSCASMLAAEGASLLEIADVLGHRTLQMTRRYSHLTQSHKVAAIEKMAKAKGL